jgi:UDP-N-acetylmuramoylalanine--D-glutamate ligase
MTPDQDWRGEKVTVLGLAIEGQDMARYFARRGARVTVADRKPRAALLPRIEALAGLDIEYRLGETDPSVVSGADLLCVSQGVPLTNPVVVAARERGVRVESMTSLFLAAYAGPVVGITGSSGKTTTTSLVDAIFSAAGREHFLGGNIGRGLLAILEQAHGDEWAVLEVSHTQLQLTRRSPQVAALLNVTPNHLDQFTWDEYVELKRRIFAFQDERDIAVFNADDPVSARLRPGARGRVLEFRTTGDSGSDGALLRDGAVFWRLDGRTEHVLDVAEIPLRGFHNAVNVAAATAVAAACGIGPEAVRAATLAFRAPEHRLELVATLGGVAYYNDSIATAPERTLAALRSFAEPVVLLLGGRDKRLPLEAMLAEALSRCRAVVCFGEAGPQFASAARGAGLDVTLAATLADAVGVASGAARAGDVVLLSPAGTSFDAYENFEQRGADFRALVARLDRTIRDGA